MGALKAQEYLSKVVKVHWLRTPFTGVANSPHGLWFELWILLDDPS